MAKTYNITDKLSTDNTVIVKVFDAELEVKTDVETVFTALEMSDMDMGIKERYTKMQELLFTEESAKKLSEMKLPFGSYQSVVETAFNIAIGRYVEEAPAGEQAMQDMT